MSNDTTLNHIELVKSIKLLLTNKYDIKDFERALYKSIPKDKIPEPTISYILIWILKNNDNRGKTKCRFLLSWISALYDYDLIEMKDLHINQIFFIRMLEDENLTAIVCKILQGIIVSRKQITRTTVRKIINFRNDRCNASDKAYLSKLLLHIKSICPDKVPESFEERFLRCKYPEIPSKLLEQLEQNGDLLKKTEILGHIKWNINIEKTKEICPIVFTNLFSSSDPNNARSKKMIEFNSIAELCSYPRNMLEYPTPILSLLYSEAGRYLISISNHEMQQKFLSQAEHELKKYLNLPAERTNRLEEEREMFLRCLFDLMELCQQGIPSISEILLSYYQNNFMVPTKSILDLITWTVPTSFDQLKLKLLQPFYTYLALSNVSLFYDLLTVIKRFLINFIVGTVHPKVAKKLQSFHTEIEIDLIYDIWTNMVVWLERFLSQAITLHGQKVNLEILRFYETISLHQHMLAPTLVIPNLEVRLAYSVLAGPSITLLNDFIGLLFNYKQQKNEIVQQHLRPHLLDEFCQNFAHVLCLNKPISFSGIPINNQTKELLKHIKSYMNINRHYAFVTYHGIAKIPEVKKHNPLLTDNYLRKLEKFGPHLAEFCKIFLAIYSNEA